MPPADPRPTATVPASAAERRPPPPPAFLGPVLRIVAKDLRVEWRSREIVYAMTFFGVLMVLIFSFAFAREGKPMHEIAGGILWATIAFAGTLGLGRIFDREREGDTQRALLLAPISPGALYLGKLLGVICFVLITEAVVMPLLVLLFHLRVSSPALLVALLLSGTIGFSAVGSLFAATLLSSRSRDILLGILLFPVVTPLIIAGAKGTAALLASPAEVAGAQVWLQLILAFDVVFLTLSLWAFGPLTRGE